MGMAGKPLCAPSGACVACLDDSACTTADAPVCDGSAHECRGCVADNECTSGVCLESNGTCPDSANVAYVRDSGSDVGTCTQTNPCLTLGYAFMQLNAPKNVVKILSTTFNVTGTPIQVTGFIDGTQTLITGGGSDGVFPVEGGDVTISGVMITPTGTKKIVADAKAGRVLFYGDTLGADVDVNGGELDVSHSTLQNVRCNDAAAASGGTFSVLQSTLYGVFATNCAVSVKQSTIDQTSLPGNDPMVTMSNSTFTIENNVVVSSNFFTDPVGLQSSAAGSTFRFNTMVNLSGENMTATPISCSGTGQDVSNNIIAWHTSTPPGCPTAYTLYDNIEALPPGQGVAIGDASTFFVDMANKNFHLAAGSPAIGAGQPGVNVTVDHDGNARPQPTGTNADVGAFEAP